jgi:hypothetical protein
MSRLHDDTLSQPAPPYAMVVLVLLEERLMRHKVVKTAT